MVSFMRATLGFEADTMREASDQLADAEASAFEDQRRAQRDPAAFRSALYPHGAEFALCHAMAQLMSAVVAVMSESLTEGIRGFYKLRKAYLTLDGIIDAEGKYVQSNPASAALVGGSSNGSPRTATFPLSAGSKLAREVHGDDAALGSATTAPASTTMQRSYSDDDADDFQDANDFQDADETHGADQLPSYLGNLEINGDLKRTESPPPDHHGPQYENLPEFSDSSSVQRIERLLSHDPTSALFENPIDVFIHSGTNLCYGMVLTLLSLIPPAFGRLLSIIGFRGDRERGLRMLWQASKFANFNGAMAGLCLFGYYNAIVGSCDILPDQKEAGPNENSRETTITGYPTGRLDALLSNMRARFPQSKLWLLEEARMQSVRQNLEGGLAILAGDIQSPLKQVHALAVFERSLQSMFAHDYTLCSASFEECIDLNNWSPALYLFIAGSAQLELYRQALGTAGKKSSKEAAKHAAKATELLQSARALAGKKKFLARQLPFDTYVLHCLNKWEARAKSQHVPFADAIGVSPLETMIFMWSGYKKMSPTHLRTSITALDHRPQDPDVAAEVADTAEERAMRAVLRAACLRSLGRLDEAKAELQERVLALDRATLHGAGRDDWPAPAACYEMAAALWAERRAAAGEVQRQRELVREAEEWLQKAAKWERYMLDARVGLRVTTGLDTVRRWRAEHDPASA